LCVLAVVAGGCGGAAEEDEGDGSYAPSELYPNARYGTAPPPGNEPKEPEIPRSTAFVRIRGVYGDLSFVPVSGAGVAWLEPAGGDAWRLQWEELGPVPAPKGLESLTDSAQLASTNSPVSPEPPGGSWSATEGLTLGGPWTLEPAGRSLSAGPAGNVYVSTPQGLVRIGPDGHHRRLFPGRRGRVVSGRSGWTALDTGSAVFVSEGAGEVQVFSGVRHASAVEVVAADSGLLRLVREPEPERVLPFMRPSLPPGRLELWRWGGEPAGEALSSSFVGMALQADGDHLFFLAPPKAEEPEPTVAKAGLLLPDKQEPDPDAVPEAKREPLCPGRCVDLWSLPLEAIADGREPTKVASAVGPVFAVSSGRVAWVQIEETAWTIVIESLAPLSTETPAERGDRQRLSVHGPMPDQIALTPFAVYWSAGNAIYRAPLGAADPPGAPVFSAAGDWSGERMPPTR